MLVLVLGQDLGLDLVDAEPARHRLGRGPVVAGQHDDPDAVGAQRRPAPAACVALIGSATAMRPAGPAVDRDEQRRGALAPELVGARPPASPRATPWSRIMPRVAERHRAAVDRAGHALARHRGELGRRPPAARPRSLAAATMAAASGCSLDRSRLAASDRTVVLRRCPARRRRRSPAACPRSACRSCRPPACRPSPAAPAPRRS